MTTDEEIADIEALAAAATPGPWVVVRQGEDRWVDTLHDVESCTIAELQTAPSAREADAAFVAACRAAVPKLIAALRDAREEISQRAETEGSLIDMLHNAKDENEILASVLRQARAERVLK